MPVGSLLPNRRAGDRQLLNIAIDLQSNFMRESLRKTTYFLGKYSLLPTFNRLSAMVAGGAVRVMTTH
jgi:hypothetical protein